MSQTTTLTLRLGTTVKARLERLAQATDRSKAFLAERAIEAYLDAQEWQVQAIEAAVHEADSPEAKFVDHVQVAARFKRLAAGARPKK